MDFNHMTIQNLTKVSRGEIYNKFDQRLVSFFDAATFKTYNHTSRKTHNNLNEKSNIVESTLSCIEHDRLPFSVIFWTPRVFSVPKLMFHLLPLAFRIL